MYTLILLSRNFTYVLKVDMRFLKHSVSNKIPRTNVKGKSCRWATPNLEVVILISNVFILIYRSDRFIYHTNVQHTYKYSCYFSVN